MHTTKCATEHLEALMTLQKALYNVVVAVATDDPAITKLIMSRPKYTKPVTPTAPLPGALMSHKKAAALIYAENRCLGY